MSASRDLPSRLLVAAVGIPLVLGLSYLGGWPLGLVVAAASAVAAHEYYRLAEASGVKPFGRVGTAGCAATVLLATALPDPAAFASAFVVLAGVVGIGTLALGTWSRWPGRPLLAASVTLSGLVYVGLGLALFPLLRAVPEVSAALRAEPLGAMGFVLLPLLATWATDSAAYFGGRAFGRRPLAPDQSPSKTVEGSLAGVAGAVLATLLTTAWLSARVTGLEIGVPAAVGIGLVLGVVGQVGDLAESVLKREAGVKDSGSLLGGHGGVLDRVDSLLFTLPVTWLLLLLLGVS